MNAAEAFAVQPERTRTYVWAVLGLFMDPNSDFTFGSHEYMADIQVLLDRPLLASIAEYIVQKLNGNTAILQFDRQFDIQLMDTLSDDHPWRKVSVEDRLKHYADVCRKVLKKHKGPMSCVANAAAVAAGLSANECDQFLNKIAAHDFSKLAFPAYFVATDDSLVPGGKSPIDRKNKQACPFFKIMFSFVQVHRLLEITHHPTVLRHTTGQLRELAWVYLQQYAQCRLTILEIVLDQVDTSLSDRYVDMDGTADTTGVNRWVDFASKKFTEGKDQEIPEPFFGGILAMLFPQIADEYANCSREVIAAVSAWTTADVRANSAVFDAIYNAYDAALAAVQRPLPRRLRTYVRSCFEMFAAIVSPTLLLLFGSCMVLLIAIARAV